MQLICSVYDSASGVFGRPIFVAARGQAVRSFTDEVGRKERDNALAMHPEDFTLYFVGTFDETTGEVVGVEHETLIRGKDAAITQG